MFLLPEFICKSFAQIRKFLRSSESSIQATTTEIVDYITWNLKQIKPTNYFNYTYYESNYRECGERPSRLLHFLRSFALNKWLLCWILIVSFESRLETESVHKLTENHRPHRPETLPPNCTTIVNKLKRV